MLCTKYSGDRIKQEMSRTCSRYVVEESIYRVLVGKPDGKIPLGRLRRRWDDNNIKINLQKAGWTGMPWLRIGRVGGVL